MGGVQQDAVMTLQHSDGTIVQQNLAVQMDTVNIPWNMEVTLIPTDWYDLYSINWTTPIPIRSDYFVDQATQIKYSVFGNIGEYADHIECRVAKYSGVTP